MIFPPTIVFQVDLSVYQAYSQPETPTDTNIPNTRSTAFLSKYLSNYVDANNQTFTAYGQDALYLQNNFTKAVDPIYGFLNVVSYT
jgi:hypothetical protein